MSKITSELRGLKILVKKDYNIKNLTSFKIGGAVELFIKVKSEAELLDVIKVLNRYKKKWMIMGNMTNVLISEKKLNMAIIVLNGFFKDIFIKNKNIFYAGAGVKISDMQNFIIKNNIKGLEFMAGIPGTLGGAIFMNAGAFGKYIGDVVKNVYALTPLLEFKIIPNEKIFSYRNSIFQKNKFIILGADINYKKGKKENIKRQIKNIIDLRKLKHPYQYPSAGSFFKNTKKHSAGTLIEKAGLKGKRMGDAEISVKHANFIINKGNARFKDVIKLSKFIKQKVYEKFKVRLKEEVKIIK